MSELRFRLKAALRNALVAFATLTACGQLWAQAAQGDPQKPIVSDPFAGLQDALSSAADSLLAATTQRRPEVPVAHSAQQGIGRTAAFQLADSVDRGKRAYLRVQQLRPVLEPILREEGVPPELAAVVLVESGGQPAALSPKGARGMWQLMPDTARRYGLIVGPDKDERLDMQKSTRAAARYLRDLYQRFGDWPLALAAYNAGEQAVDTAVRKVGLNQFALISNFLPLETRNYVPSVLGAIGQLSNLRPRLLLARGTARVLYAAATVD